MGGKNQVHKEVRDLIRFAESLGFEWVGFTGKMHPLLKHPNGGATTISGTPGGRSGAHNAKSQLRRIARGDHR